MEPRRLATKKQKRHKCVTLWIRLVHADAAMHFVILHNFVRFFFKYCFVFFENLHMKEILIASNAI